LAKRAGHWSRAPKLLRELKRNTKISVQTGVELVKISETGVELQNLFLVWG